MVLMERGGRGEDRDRLERAGGHEREGKGRARQAWQGKRREAGYGTVGRAVGQSVGRSVGN